MKILRLFSLLVVFTVPGGVLAQSGPERIRISYSSGGVTSIDLFIARDKKYFQEQKLNAELIRMPANLAISAGISGEVDVLGSIGSAIRSIQRGAPLRVVSVTLRRPLFFLVARPEYNAIKDLKGKTMGIVTFGGSQHTTAKRMLALGGINADKELTAIQVGEESVLLQALTTNAIQVAAISPPYAQIAREKFNMKILETSTDKFASIQNGAAVSLKTLQERPEFLKRFLRARALANKYFMEREKEASELLASIWNSDVKIALDSYRASKPAFTGTGIPSDDEIKEYLALDAQIIGLAQPVPAASVFDFTLQREINKELGIR
ncbi:MAG TPA: ABC transporter substrate-binding protein [Terriglobales bacterium]|jgi:ABC-type nitrate/sulfonate/bicarbonate transport system substrate-binding protein|nr:ABC transporter substrate-binding protein [Terriglobales bacterium]